MKLGDKLTWTPSGFDQEKSSKAPDRQHKLRSVTGRIAYIHPEGRYYLAEAHVGREVIRECFPIKQQG